MRFWNRKISLEVGLRGAKTFKSFFLETVFMTKLWDTRGSNSGNFLSIDLKICSFIAKYNWSSKPYQFFLEILKTFQVITIKLRRFRLGKCYFVVLAVKYKQSGFSKNADTVLDCKQCQIWKCNHWCHQTQHVRLGTPERENKGRKTRHSFSLFIWNYQIKIKQQFREFNKLFSDI